MTELPQFFRVKQKIAAPRIDNVADAVEGELERLSLATRVSVGESIAITAGSRGIAHISVIIRAIVDHLQRIGCKPFIVPAMGSHGGATAEGQVKVLETYGITESFCGCPIHSSMETILVGESQEGIPIHFDRNAWEADHVIVCGRVKPHTGFVGPIESGLMKMMLIGLGKHAGARLYHRAIQNYSFDQIVRSVGREVIQRCGILCGVAIVENQFEETALIEGLLPNEFEQREPELLERAKMLIPRIPVSHADLLIVDQIGKNISGTGMDTNVVGRKYHDHEAAESETPQIKRIAVRDLTDETQGNATGIGIAEFCHSRVIDKMNIDATRVNSLTGGHPTAAMLPLDYPSDLAMLAAALPTIGLTDPPDARIVWIHNTLDIAQIELSTAYLEEVSGNDQLAIIVPPRSVGFDDAGNLPAMKDLTP